MREPGDGSPLCRYEPQTEVFVHDHAGELRELDSFGTACAAIETVRPRHHLSRADGGRRSRADPRKRAEISWDRLPLPPVDGQHPTSRSRSSRLDAAIDELETGARRRRRADRGDRAAARAADADRQTRPRAGLDRPRRHRRRSGRGPQRRRARRVAVGAGVSGRGLRRRGAAMRTATRSNQAWPPSRRFAAWSPPCGCSRPAASGSARTPGPASAGDRWRRIATGAGRQRPGGYRLTEAELGDLLAFSRPQRPRYPVRAPRSAGALASRRFSAARSAGSRLASSATSSSRRSTTTCSRPSLPARGWRSRRPRHPMRVSALVRRARRARRGQGRRRSRDRPRARALER